MNIHEYQAKEILKEYGAPVSNGVAIFTEGEIDEKIKGLKSKQFVVKAQIHAGGRGKAGGVKLIKDLDNLTEESKKMFGKVLITHQTGPEGKKVKKIYIEEASDILKEFYLSCLIDRESSKIAFISSTEGGMDIEKVATDNPEKINTTKVDFNSNIDDVSILKILKPFNLEKDQIPYKDSSFTHVLLYAVIELSSKHIMLLVVATFYLSQPLLVMSSLEITLKMLLASSSVMVNHRTHDVALTLLML